MKNTSAIRAHAIIVNGKIYRDSVLKVFADGPEKFIIEPLIFEPANTVCVNGIIVIAPKSYSIQPDFVITAENFNDAIKILSRTVPPASDGSYSFHTIELQ